MNLNSIKIFITCFVFLTQFGFAYIATAKIINEESEALFHTDCNNFNSASLVVHRDGKFETGIFQVNHPGKGQFIFGNEDFVCGDIKRSYPLVNFNLPFIEIKDNAIAFVHPFFLVKFLHILSEMNFNQRVTDALRTSEDQLRYKRRGWTGTENSPHMIGLAADLGSYGVSDRNSISELCTLLNLRFLEHGRGANRHIHIQDNTVWRGIDTSDVKPLSDAFNNDADVDRYCRAASYITLKHDRIKFSERFNIVAEGHTTLRIEFTDVIGIVNATFYSGVFKQNNDIFFNTSFLPPGIYKADIYINESKVGQRVIAVN